MLLPFSIPEKKKPCSRTTNNSLSIFHSLLKLIYTTACLRTVFCHTKYVLCCLVTAQSPWNRIWQYFLTLRSTIVHRSSQWNNALVQRSTKSNDKLSVTSIMLAMHRNIYIWWLLWHMNVQDKKGKIHFKFCICEKLAMICNLHLALNSINLLVFSALKAWS